MWILTVGVFMNFSRLGLIIIKVKIRYSTKGFEVKIFLLNISRAPQYQRSLDTRIFEHGYSILGFFEQSGAAEKKKIQTAISNKYATFEAKTKYTKSLLNTNSFYTNFTNKHF